MTSRAQGETDRRLGNVAQFGVVEEVDYSSPPRARARIGELLTGWVRMGGGRSGDAQVSWGYSVGEEVVLVAPSGDLRQAAIVSSLPNSTNAANAAEGTYRVALPGGASAEIAGGVMTLSAPGGINITGDVIVTGDVIADGISLKTHKHGGVTPGAAKTGEPE